MVEAQKIRIALGKGEGPEPTRTAREKGKPHHKKWNAEGACVTGSHVTRTRGKLEVPEKGKNRYLLLRWEDKVTECEILSTPGREGGRIVQSAVKKQPGGGGKEAQISSRQLWSGRGIQFELGDRPGPTPKFHLGRRWNSREDILEEKGAGRVGAIFRKIETMLKETLRRIKLERGEDHYFRYGKV